MEQDDLTIINDNDVVTTRCHDLYLSIEQCDLTIIDGLTCESKLINEVTNEITIDHPINEAS